MKYALAYQGFTVDHPIVGSAILAVVVCVALFFLSIAATQGKALVLFAVIYGVGACLIFFANWIGAVRIKRASMKSTRSV